MTIVRQNSAAHTVFGTDVYGTDLDGKRPSAAFAPFSPSAHHRSRTACEKNGRRYTAIANKGDGGYSVSIHPAWRAAPTGVQTDAFKRVCFDDPDVRAMHLDLDASDGELVYHLGKVGYAEVDRMGASLEDAVDFLEAFYPRFLEFVAQTLGAQKADDEDDDDWPFE